MQWLQADMLGLRLRTARWTHGLTELLTSRRGCPRLLGLRAAAARRRPRASLVKLSDLVRLLLQQLPQLRDLSRVPGPLVRL